MPPYSSVAKAMDDLTLGCEVSGGMLTGGDGWAECCWVGWGCLLCWDNGECFMFCESQACYNANPDPYATECSDESIDSETITKQHLPPQPFTPSGSQGDFKPVTPPPQQPVQPSTSPEQPETIKPQDPGQTKPPQKPPGKTQPTGPQPLRIPPLLPPHPPIVK